MTYTLKEIKNSFDPASEKNCSILIRIIRQASFYVTFITLKMGIKTTNQATVVALLLGLASAISFLVIQKDFFWVGTLFYILNLVYDRVDGNIARITDTATYFGKFLDSAVDNFVQIFVVMFMTLGFYFSKGSEPLLIAGVAIGTIWIFGTFLINRLSFFTRLITIERIESKRFSSDAIDMAGLNPFDSTKIPIRSIMNYTLEFQVLVLAIASIIGMTTLLFSIFLAQFALYAMTKNVVGIVEALKRINIRRVSIRAPKRPERL